MDKFKSIELKRYIALINYVFLLILIIMNFNPILAFLLKVIKIFRPVIIGIILAFIINLPMKAIEYKLSGWLKNSKLLKRVRLISYILAMIFVLAILVFIVNLVVPELSSSIRTLITNISKQSSLIDLSGLLSKFKFADNIQGIDINTILAGSGLTTESITAKLTEIISSISGGLYTFLTTAGSTLIDWMMGIFISMYFLLKKEETLQRLQDFLIAILPKDIHHVVFQYLKTYYRIFEMFVGKRLIESAILGFIEYIGCVIFNFPYAALIAVLTAVLSIIPYFGCLIAVVIGWVLIIPVSFVKSILFIIIFEIITIFESNVIYPRVVGKSLGLPEVWTLIGLIVFGAFWGFMGMLIAVPITACIYVSLQDFIRYKKLKLKEENDYEEKILDQEIKEIRAHKKAEKDA